jgi:hypothetical protein
MLRGIRAPKQGLRGGETIVRQLESEGAQVGWIGPLDGPTLGQEAPDGLRDRGAINPQFLADRLQPHPPIHRQYRQHVHLSGRGGVARTFLLQRLVEGLFELPQQEPDLGARRSRWLVSGYQVRVGQRALRIESSGGQGR